MLNMVTYTVISLNVFYFVFLLPFREGVDKDHSEIVYGLTRITVKFNFFLFKIILIKQC